MVWSPSKLRSALNDGTLKSVSAPEIVLQCTAVVIRGSTCIGRNLSCLRQFAKNWMPLLFNAYVAAPAGQRSHLSRAISAYAVLVEPGLLDTFFKTVVKKLIVASASPESPFTSAIRQAIICGIFYLQYRPHKG